MVNKPSNGHIYIDNKEVKYGMEGEWQSKIGYVTQNLHVDNGTVAENLIYDFDFGLSENDLQQKMISSCKSANIFNFIQKLQHGFNTVIGENGFGLSGGEIQRLILARELMRSPEVLILDEPTSALDIDNVIKIKSTLAELKDKLTIIIVTHSDEFDNISDFIYYVSNGNIEYKK